MSTFDDMEALAAEYVLGTLDTAERAEVARRRTNEPSLDAAIRAWEVRLAPLDEAGLPAAPPRDLYDKIERRLGRAAPAAVSEPEASSARVIQLERRVRRWKAAAVTFGALAASLVIAVGLEEFLRRQVPASYVAVLQQGGQGPAFVVTVDLAGGTLTARPVAAEQQAGKSYELWLVSETLGAPKSLGLIAPEGYTVRPGLANYDRKVVEGATYAVSLEPEGGSKTGAPTGPVLYTGKLVQTTP